MSTLVVTIAIAFIFVLIAVAALGISWLITGKLSLKSGACGRDPTKKKDEDCGTSASCGLCKKEKEEDKKH